MCKHLNIKTIAILITIAIIAISCSQKPDGTTIPNLDSINSKNLKQEQLSPKDSIAGKLVYESRCLVCHQPNGLGIKGIYPPLANSDYLLIDKLRALDNVVNGFKDSIVVNGTTYKKHLMPEIDLTDEQIRDVMNYILNSWGNKGGIITIEDVKKVQK
jgi:nitrite reductase (NO-forming)